MYKASKIKIVLFLKGLVIGLAFIIPGVSGGTMALITGLYSKLIYLLSDIRFSTFFIKGDFLKSWNSFYYLFPAFVGGVLGFILMARWISFFIQDYPFETYCFFSGIILSSIPALYRHIQKHWLDITIFITASILSFLGSFFNSTLIPGGPWLFLSVYLAVAAMLLPGVSGSYILIIMGTYSYILQDISSLSMNLISYTLIGVFSLVTFSKLIRYLLNHFQRKTMAFLTGLTLGGGLGIFPVKSIEQIKDSGLLALSFLILSIGVFILVNLLTHSFIRKRNFMMGK